MCRTLRETEPPPPSTLLTTLGNTRLAAIAAQHHAEPQQIISSLRGDLDWIVMKAMEKDRGRRYETANELATDLPQNPWSKAGLKSIRGLPPGAHFRWPS